MSFYVVLPIFLVFFYWIACRETKHQITGKEKVMIGLICVAALLSIGLLAVGWIKI